MQNPQQPQYNDEIDLKDLILALWQGKWIIIASVVFALVAALAYLNLVPQTYKGQIALKAPSSAQVLALQANTQTDAMVLTSNSLGQAVINSLQQSGLSISGKAPNWTINFTTNLPDQAQENWQAKMPEYLAEAQHTLALEYDASIANLGLEQTKAIEELKKQIYLAKVAGIVANTSVDITAETLPYIRGYKVLQAEVELLENQLAKLGAKPAANPFQGEPLALINYNLDNISLQPKIKPTLLLALSFVLGGMLGVFILIIRNVLRDK